MYFGQLLWYNMRKQAVLEERMINDLNHKSLPERTADAIANMLHRENYGVGSKLPNELKLAEIFEVSRATIRKAEAILAQQGILEIERGSGTFVSSRLGIQNDPLGFSFIYDKRKLLLDLLQLRLMIEPTCASLAAQNATKDDIKLLHRLCDEMDSSISRGSSYLQQDMEFHQAVANSGGNSAIHNLIPYIHQMQILQDSVAIEYHRHETAAEHRRILNAIEQHRGVDAHDAMQWHLMVVYGRYQSRK